MKGLTDRDRAMKIVRVVTADGQRVVGLRAPPELLPMIPQLTAYSEGPPAMRTPRTVPDSDYQLMYNSFFQHKFQEWVQRGMDQTVALGIAMKDATDYIQKQKLEQTLLAEAFQKSHVQAMAAWNKKKLDFDASQRPLKSQEPTVVHAGAQKKASRKPKNMLSFFKQIKKPAAGGGGGGAAAAASDGGGTKRKADDVLRSAKTAKSTTASLKKKTKKTTVAQPPLPKGQHPFFAAKPKPSTKVECPSCNKSIPAAKINGHLDGCL